MLRHAFASPKLAALGRKLDLRRYQVVGVLEHLWYFTATQAPRGDIGRWTDEEIAAALDWEREPAELIEGLLATRWIDRCSVHRLVVHDWEEHSDRNVKGAPQVKQHGFARVCAGADLSQRTTEGMRAGAEVPGRCLPEPEPEPEPEPDTDPSQREARSTAADDRTDSEPADPEPVTPGHPLLRLLAKMDGSVEEKTLWLEHELPVIEAEAADGGKKIATLAVRFYRHYLDRPATERHPKRRWREEVELRKVRAGIRARAEARARESPCPEPEVDMSQFNVSRI